jgi:hypothetical protein
MKEANTIDAAMCFVGDMLNHAFLTEKGRQTFNLFYKSGSRDAAGASQAAERPR